MTTLLPAAFADLEPFAATWCLASEPERWACRQASSMEEMRTFYDATFPRAEEAIAHCDGFDLGDLPADVEHLLQLMHSLAMVSYAIEVWGQKLPVHTGAAIIDRTREPRS